MLVMQIRQNKREDVRSRMLSYINLVLTQSSGFDVLAAMSMGLTRNGVKHNFIYPYPVGPRQGTAVEALQFLKSYGLDERLFLDLSKFRNRFFMRRIVRNASLNIVQDPYMDTHFHPNFLKKLIESKKIAYSNYGLNLADTPDLHYYLESYRMFGSILTSSQKDIKAFNLAGIESSKLTQIGNPLSFEIRSRGEKFAIKPHNPEIIRILWAPHWDKSWSNWEVTLPIIIEVLQNNPEIFLTFRPHPLLLPGLQGRLPEGYSFAGAQQTDSIMKLSALLRQHNVELSTSSLLDDCLTNDLLITDGVSIIGFWSATNKPMAVLRRQDSPSFNLEIADLGSCIDFINPHSTDLANWIICHKTISSKKSKTDYEFFDPFLVYVNGRPIDPAVILREVLQSCVV